MTLEFAPHFPRTELEHSDKAIEHGIPNVCPDELLPYLVLISWKAEQARKILGVRCRVNSGYRSPALNHIICKGSSSTGVHPLGLAVDILPLDGKDLVGAFAELQDDREFMQDVDQLILENGCIHIGLPYPGKAPRHELRRDEWVDGVRHYPLIGIWKPRD